MRAVSSADSLPCSDYIRELVDAVTLAEIVALVCRSTGADFAHATAIIMSAEELTVFRDEAGRIEGAHGFRFVDVPGGKSTYRLIHAVFSVISMRAARARSQFGSLIERTTEHEYRAPTAKRSVIWAFSPECDPTLADCAALMLPVRELFPERGPACRVVFLADRSVEGGNRLPASVMLDVADIALARQEAEDKIRDRRWCAAMLPMERMETSVEIPIAA